MWSLLLTAGLIFFGSRNAGMQDNTINKEDTVLLYKKDTLLITGTAPAVLLCNFPTAAHAQYNSGFRTLLLLENPTVVTLPEGVYELYVTKQLPRINDLSFSQPAFVSVLDMYSFTAPAAKKRLEMDISEHIKKLFLQNKTLSLLYISVRFGPIRLPDGTYSSKAGEVHFSGIKIVQVKN